MTDAGDEDVLSVTQRLNGCYRYARARGVQDVSIFIRKIENWSRPMSELFIEEDLQSLSHGHDSAELAIYVLGMPMCILLLRHSAHITR